MYHDFEVFFNQLNLHNLMSYESKLLPLNVLKQFYFQIMTHVFAIKFLSQKMMSKTIIFIMHGKIKKIIFFMKNHKIVLKLFVAII
jgi:hypothetical protein